MTPADAASVLTKLTAGYDRKMRDDTARIWLEQLADLDTDKALATVRAVIATSGRFPTVAEFRAVYASSNPPRPFTPLDDDEPCLAAEDVRARIADLKRQLEQARNSTAEDGE